MDGRTKVYGVMGDPIEHSMSPLMHNFYARRTGKDLVYVPFHVNRGTVEAAVKEILETMEEQLGFAKAPVTRT